MIVWYKESTGVTEVDMHEVAKFAVSKGWTPPKPPTVLDLLAKQFTNAAREVIRHDRITRRPYRAYHHFFERHGQTRLSLWVDIDEAPRKRMHKSLILRREQMIGDGLQLTLDSDHWNSIHPDEEPIVIPMDFTEDIEERKNAPDEYRDAS